MDTPAMEVIEVPPFPLLDILGFSELEEKALQAMLGSGDRPTLEGALRASLIDLKDKAITEDATSVQKRVAAKLDHLDHETATKVAQIIGA